MNTFYLMVHSRSPQKKYVYLQIILMKFYIIIIDQLYMKPSLHLKHTPLLFWETYGRFVSDFTPP